MTYMRAIQALVASLMAAGLTLGGTSAAQAEGNPPDPYLQIASGAPVQLIAQAQADGPPRDFYYGRAYVGPNGLEVRLTNEGTVLLLHDGGTFIAALSVLVVPEASVAAKLAASIVQATAVNTFSNHVSSYVDNHVLAGKCLGLTLPPQAVATRFRQVINLSEGNYFQAWVAGSPKPDIAVWLEPCTD
ncbi:hypothetical protein ABZ896_17200 [Streptomyces sp. NPDC047072]|uniref:hypothetical protein n=1 Tax=Streptomyces sp. NPDC047072 TaxID=3154809 RepID=UPI0033FAE581